MGAPKPPDPAQQAQATTQAQISGLEQFLPYYQGQLDKQHQEARQTLNNVYGGGQIGPAERAAISSRPPEQMPFNPPQQSFPGQAIPPSTPPQGANGPQGVPQQQLPRPGMGHTPHTGPIMPQGPAENPSFGSSFAQMFNPRHPPHRG